MKLNQCIFLCITGLLPVAVSILQMVYHKYDLAMTPMTWKVAQNYCRLMYSDLAKMGDDSDWLRFKVEAASNGLGSEAAWVGLYNDIDSWTWSYKNIPLKNVTFKNWFSGLPDNYGGNEACGAIGYTFGWDDLSCSLLKPFICYNANFSGAKFIGISSPWLNWSDAQTYCRTHYTDLASSINSSDNNLLGQVRNIQGDSWFGLYRNTWKWSDGTNASNLPWAPGQPDNYKGNQNCGVVINGLLYDDVCNIQYCFFCHTNFPARSQTVRLQVKSDGSVFDPAVQSSILLQVQQTLKANGMLKNTTVTWKVQTDGKIFHKKKKNDQ